MKPPKIYSILPKLLHGRINPAQLPVKESEHFLIFFDTSMDFYLRKVLKANGIKYTWHRKDRLLTVNYTNSPFKLFMIFEDNTNYITVRRIPWDDFEYKINAITLDELFKKMLRFKIINLNNFKMLIIPIHLQAQQLKLIMG
jgi:hypothetical protein